LLATGRRRANWPRTPQRVVRQPGYPCKPGAPGRPRPARPTAVARRPRRMRRAGPWCEPRRQGVL